MRKIISLLLLISLCSNLLAHPTKRQIRNLNAFTQLYGYVRFFHPADEGINFNWYRFAAYGSIRMLTIKNDTELVEVLNKIFLPIAPTIKVYLTKDGTNQSTEDLTPRNKTNYHPVFWQHLGLQLRPDDKIYISRRVNRDLVSHDDTLTKTFVPLSRVIDISEYNSKNFIFSLIANTGGHSGNKNKVKYDPTLNSEVRSAGFKSLQEATEITDIKSTYKFGGKFPDQGKKIVFGITTNFVTPISIDNLKLEVEKNGKLTDIRLETPNCQHPDTLADVLKYSLEITDSSALPDTLFDHQIKMGEVIRRQLQPGISCMVPLALYANRVSTYPSGDTLMKRELLNDMYQKMAKDENGHIIDSGEILAIRLCDIIVTWNILKNFYPYWSDSKIQPIELLDNSIEKAFTDKTSMNFLVTLESMVSKLNDGHMVVTLGAGKNTDNASAAIVLASIDKRLVVKDVLDKSTANAIKPGDIIEMINDLPADQYLAKKEALISGSAQWKLYKALFTLTNGPADLPLKLVLSRNGHKIKLSLNRNQAAVIYRPGFSGAKEVKTGWIKPGIFYLNLCTDSITNHMNDLKTASAVIFDLRGYPIQNDAELISHLLKKPEITNWGFVPEILYPEYKHVHYKNDSWHLTPISPYFSGKIYLLTDASAISASETIVGYFKDLKLATIIGEPTAGTNGDINTIYMLGDFSLSFTGMVITNHDGTRHHLIGILPDIKVSPTLRSVRKQEDMQLDTALTIALKDLHATTEK